MSVDGTRPIVRKAADAGAAGTDTAERLPTGTIAIDASAPRPRGEPEPGLGRETRPWARVARLAVGDAGDRAPAALSGFSSSTIRLIVSAFFTVRAVISPGLGERLVHPFVRVLGRSTLALVSGWPDMGQPGGWIIPARAPWQPGSMSTAASPVPLSHPPSQQARPTSPSRSPRGLLPRWACAVLAACLALAVFAAGPHTPKADTSSITGDQDLAKQVIDLLPDDYQARGIHVSVITAEGARHAGIGTAASGQQYTSTTPMEIGSITKTFTGQLLADAIARGEVKADEPLSAHLPELAGTPAGEATLEEIASHRSGLPSFPSQDMGRLLRAQILGLNPFTDSIDQLIDSARTTELGERGEFAYSNLGISLLGEALARAAGADSWSSYITERLFTPLGMERTTLTIGQEDIPDGAIHGVQANGRRGQSLSGPGSSPAGPEDMTRYAQAVLAGTVPGDDSAQEPRWPATGVMDGTPLPGERIGYTWYTDVVDGRTIISHGGITMEYVTHLAIDKESGTAVMVFTDQNNDGTASALAAALLTDGQKISAAHAPLSAEMLPQIMILGIFTILALVMGLYTAARAASVPSRMAAVCRAASLIACLMAAAASGPWAYLPGWILAVAASPGMYGVVRGIALWSELPALPRRRAWLGWMQVGLSAAFVGACLVVAWPKA